MEAYRDQYASLFNNGRDVVLIGISTDSPEELRSWAKDADFPFLFGSDPSSTGYAAFGGNPRDNGMVGSRAVVVVNPEGRIAGLIPTFMQMDPTAYEELGEIISSTLPASDSGN